MLSFFVDTPFLLCTTLISIFSPLCDLMKSSFPRPSKFSHDYFAFMLSIGFMIFSTVTVSPMQSMIVCISL